MIVSLIVYHLSDINYAQHRSNVDKRSEFSSLLNKRITIIGHTSNIVFGYIELVCVTLEGEKKSLFQTRNNKLCIFYF